MPHRAHELGQPLERIIFALDRHKKGVGGAKAVERQKPQRRRAVDENEVIVVPKRRQRRFQAVFPSRHFDKLDLRTRQLNTGRQHRQPRKLGAHHHIGGLCPAGEQLIGGGGNGALVDADAARGVALRIDVRKQHPLSGSPQRRRQIDRGRGLADAALLIDHRNDLCHVSPPLPSHGRKKLLYDIQYSTLFPR